MGVRSVTASVLLVVVSALAGCTQSGSHEHAQPTTTAGASDQSAFTLDRGALRVAAVTAPTPTVPRSTAARILASTDMPVPGELTPVLASVSFTAPAGARSGTTLDRLHLDVAWVYVVREPPRTPNCSGPLRATTAVPADASYATALVVDARTGAAYTYLGAGMGPCDPRPTPELQRTDLFVSVRFALRKVGPRTLSQTIHLPACGHLSSFGGARMLQAVAAVATGPCHGSPRTVVQNLYGRVRALPYARLGLVCWRTFDAMYGKPTDCVSAW